MNLRGLSAEYGKERAREDFRRITDRAYNATIAQLDSRAWRTKGILRAWWIGFVAPPLWSPAGRAYNRELRRLRKDWGSV